MERVNRFGTTQDMIIQEVIEGDATYLLAIDARGLYLTTPDRIDTRMADLNRYAVARKSFEERLEKLGFSPVDIFEEHKGKIQTVGDANKKKINPLKASKRGLS
ncbi:hypothetical protein [Pseudodesulfovibrio piezophilus]|uniref:Uncharacterized protein n=1 Tax=Pseudodesulfovibrio piezophilus (strain DSM 21447 / JCM 15486 / C1TLV30) TaxID=1322246 RepID=M1WJP7_PSEP2|nr:hypothetical protein [Pseudodesulfovibrio piezophilus]CCH48266.1 conserved protein of unknown function [Pseudodesulfovibrio piezophilus C1TLV30]